MADVVWVASAAAIVASDLMTSLGDVLLGGVSLLVAGFAAAQVVGLRRAGDAHELGRSYRMEVDTSTYPLRHRAVLHQFGMTWQVDPDGTGTRLTLTFTGTAKLGVLGRLVLAALRRDDPAGRIVDACAARFAASR